MSDLVKAAAALRDALKTARETAAAHERALEDLDTAKRDLIALCSGDALLEPQSPQDEDSGEGEQAESANGHSYEPVIDPRYSQPE